jgi:Short C-terminal domain
MEKCDGRGPIEATAQRYAALAEKFERVRKPEAPAVSVESRAAMHTKLLPAAACLAVTACSVTAPVQPAATSKSGFEGAVYKGQTVTVSAGTPGATQYRIFQQGATGFVSEQSVRETAEQRATEFCERKGKAMESITETTATPPYILGNFPRIEIVFDCVDKATAAAVASTEDKYAKIAKLKQLLDSGALTQAEFDREKAKVLGQP